MLGYRHTINYQSKTRSEERNSTMKKLLSFLILVTLVFTMSSCGKKAEPQPQTNEKETVKEKEIPATEKNKTTALDYIGIYSCDQNSFKKLGARSLSISVDAASGTEMNITILWGKNAFEGYEWNMSGEFDINTNTFTYHDAEKKYNVIYGDERTGYMETTIEYSDGTGTMTFSGDTLTWQDDKENVADNITFKK